MLDRRLSLHEVHRGPNPAANFWARLLSFLSIPASAMPKQPNRELILAVTEAATAAALLADRGILLAFQSFYQETSAAADRAAIQAKAAAIVAACEPYLKAHPDLKDAITRLRALITPTNPA